MNDEKIIDEKCAKNLEKVTSYDLAESYADQCMFRMGFFRRIHLGFINIITSI